MLSLKLTSLKLPYISSKKKVQSDVLGLVSFFCREGRGEKEKSGFILGRGKNIWPSYSQKPLVHRFGPRTYIAMPTTKPRLGHSYWFFRFMLSNLNF